MKTIITTIILFAFILSPMLVSAQQNSMNNTGISLQNAEELKAKIKNQEQLQIHLENREQNREELRARFEEKKMQLTQNREERRVRLEEKKRQIAKNLADNIFRRFENFLDRLSRISERISERLDILTDKGLDVSDQEDMLAEANAELVIVSEDIAEAKILFDTEISNETSKEELRAIIETAKESLRNAHSSYVDVISSIKAGLLITDQSGSDE